MRERKERQPSSSPGFLFRRDSNFIGRNDPPIQIRLSRGRWEGVGIRRRLMKRGFTKKKEKKEKNGARNDAAIFSSILKITLRERVTLVWNRNAKTSEKKSDWETIRSGYGETERDVEVVKGGWRDKKMSTDQKHSPRKVEWNFFFPKLFHLTDGLYKLRELLRKLRQIRDCLRPAGVDE